jgi:hypothetical protein
MGSAETVATDFAGSLMPITLCHHCLALLVLLLQELEDMLLRYERQLKSEIQARQAAEAAAAEALAGFSQSPGGGTQLTADWEHQQEQLQQVCSYVLH